jgi:hypothetical protein
VCCGTSVDEMTQALCSQGIREPAAIQRSMVRKNCHCASAEKAVIHERPNGPIAPKGVATAGSLCFKNNGGCHVSLPSERRTENHLEEHNSFVKSEEEQAAIFFQRFLRSYRLLDFVACRVLGDQEKSAYNVSLVLVFC